LIETAVGLAVGGTVVIAAFDPARLGPEGRAVAEALFEVICDVGAIGGGDGKALASRLLSGSGPPAAAGATRPRLAEPLEETETRALAAAGGLVGANPRALKRLINAYRLARGEDAPRGMLALALAARLSVDPDNAAALRHALFAEGEALTTPAHPAALGEAFAAVGAPGTDKAAARRAWELARRYAPCGD
jgi:hypothetical protein